jgi:coenzyme F420-reducing hydrogenase delta subunit/Pyruvate/2-oxoacid:ferredoxin oxidoreductase delta subunit
MPAPLGEEGHALSTPQSVPIDLLYSFWLPLAARTTAGVTLLVFGVVSAVGLLVPLLSRPTRAAGPAASSVDARLCTGCEQCYQDCPYEAIEMTARADGREGVVAHVDTSLCVGCGICAGSCAPMGVGPSGRTGRDQLGRVRELVGRTGVQAGEVVVLACERGAVGAAAHANWESCRVERVPCAGNLHTSVIEYWVRSGVGGVMIVACPPRDCWNREGPKWLEERLYHDREAELKARVDRARVRVVHASAFEEAVVATELAAFRNALEAATMPEEAIDIVAMCERTESQAGS